MVCLNAACSDLVWSEWLFFAIKLLQIEFSRGSMRVSFRKSPQLGEEAERNESN